MTAVLHQSFVYTSGNHYIISNIPAPRQLFDKNRLQILATIWLPKLEKDAFGSQTIQNGTIEKTVALQYFSIHRKTIKNGKISTRNEKVACSSQVTSSKIRDTPLGYPLF